MKKANLIRALAACALFALLLTACAGPAGTTEPTQTTAPAVQTQSSQAPGSEPTLPPETVLPEDNSPVALAIGEYLVNEVALDEGGVSNADCGVLLRDDGTCMLYMGWGMWHEGSYEIQNSQLICRSTKLEWDGGGGPGSRETDVVFTFAIREENLLELTDITVGDPDTHNLVSPAAFTVGMTYSIHGA